MACRWIPTLTFRLIDQSTTVKKVSLTLHVILRRLCALGLDLQPWCLHLPALSSAGLMSQRGRWGGLCNMQSPPTSIVEGSLLCCTRVADVDFDARFSCWLPTYLVIELSPLCSRYVTHGLVFVRIVRVSSHVAVKSALCVPYLPSKSRRRVLNFAPQSTREATPHRAAIIYGLLMLVRNIAVRYMATRPR